MSEFTTIVGMVADEIGAVEHVRDEVFRAIAPGGVDLRRVVRHRDLSCDTAAKYASRQPDAIPILWCHRRGDELGKTVLLDRRQGRLFAVGVLGPHEDGLYDDVAPLWFSSGTTIDPPFEFRELSLTHNPASMMLSPVAFYPGLLPAEAAQAVDAWPRTLLRNAAEVVRSKYVVHEARCRFDDADAPPPPERNPTIELRRASTGRVDFEHRTIEVIAVPYGQEADIEYQGKPMREVFERGAFRDIDPAKSHITVNRDHSYERTIGKIVGLRDEAHGAVAVAKISKTPLGDETLRLADDGILKASIGAAIARSGMEIRNGLRRVFRISLLDHVALLPNPAYHGATVLGVRAAQR